VTDTPAALPIQPIPPQRRRTGLTKAVYWLIVSLVLVVVARRSGSREAVIPGFFSVGIPLLLLQFRAWKRWLRPERLPTRWPSGYRPGEQLQALDSALFLTGFAGIGASWVFDKSSHPHAYMALGVICCGAFAWQGVLQEYISDRKHIPPPSPPYDPSKPAKPLRSDHWGQRREPA
jgi:hypothetical protein